MRLENTTCAHTSDTLKNNGIFILPSCHERGTRKIQRNRVSGIRFLRLVAQPLSQYYQLS